MSRRDDFHYPVRRALEKEGWAITHDPVILTFRDLRLKADLGAERYLAAEKEGRRVVVEVKDFDTTNKCIKCGSIYCNSNSICNPQINKCDCIYGWTNKNYTTSDSVLSLDSHDNNSGRTSETIEYCTYKQKNQLTAFLLEVTLSFGIGHYYSGNYIIASFKIFLLLFSYCGCFSLFFVLGCKKSVGNGQYTEKILFFVSCRSR